MTACVVPTCQNDAAKGCVICDSCEATLSALEDSVAGAWPPKQKWFRLTVPWWLRWRPSVRRWLRETEQRIRQELDNRPRRR